MCAEYAISGGDVDADRLARQASVMASATQRFLLRAGLTQGTACLDVGCGQGQVSIAMARVVGPRGRVVGTDIDKVALSAAARAAHDVGVQVDFVLADAADIVEVQAFDLAYSRLVLSHLIDPVSALRAMRAAVRPAGVVAVEDLLTGTLRSEPPHRVLDDLQELYAATVRARGGDPTIGPRLAALLEANGIGDIAIEVIENPMTSIGEKLFLVELVRNMRSAIIESGVAADPEVDAIARQIEGVARDPSTTFFQAHMYQVFGRRLDELM